MVQAGEDAEAVCQQDMPEALRLLFEMSESADKVSSLVGNMLGKVKRGELSTEEGLSFLEVKYHTLLSYLINLSQVVMRKVSGVTIYNEPCVDRLVELRTVLERLRPIDKRLKYQIDKLVKTAVTGESSDASSFRANPDNMVSKLDEDSDSSDEEEDGATEKKSVYVPPKLAPVHYDGDESAASRQEKLLERAKRRALSSAMVRELREEFLDAPTELGSRVDSGAGPSGPSKEDQERQEYEETYFTRLPETKDKRKKRKLPTIGSLANELTNFDSDFRVLEGEMTPMKKKKSSKKPSGKKGKKGFKKRKSR